MKLHKKGLFLNIKYNIVLNMWMDDDGNVLGKNKYNDLKYCIRIKLISKLKRMNDELEKILNNLCKLFKLNRKLFDIWCIHDTGKYIRYDKKFIGGIYENEFYNYSINYWEDYLIRGLMRTKQIKLISRMKKV